MLVRHTVAGAALLAAACSVSGVVGVDVDETDSGADTTGPVPDGGSGMPATSGDQLDVGSDSTLCQAFGSQEDFAPCKLVGPVDAFEPTLQWAWNGDGNFTDSFVAPLVANLTDDNGDGAVDLCDTPDIVVLAAPPIPGGNISLAGAGRLFVLDGANGIVHHAIDDAFLPGYTPALGDVDGDGVVDIVAVVDATADAGTPSARIKIYAADGTELVAGETIWPRSTMGAVALANLDAAGDVEILVDHMVLDARGRAVFSIEPSDNPLLPIAVDLDGDGRLEALWGHQAADAEGNLLFPERGDFRDGYPQVANFDGDPGPEILITSELGLVMLDSDGSILAGPVRPAWMGERVPEGPLTWRRPAAIHDIDGDGAPEIAMSAGEQFMAIAYRAQRFEIRWQQPVVDWSGVAAATAFDFLGDGTAEAVYADESTLWLYDLSGRDVLAEERTSITLQEMPVVADIDNDGSAEILVVSNRGYSGQLAPTLRAWGEELGRWVPARRIWNQHSYHVTNVEEDGAIPQAEVAGYRRLNTFRTNVQIEGGQICTPEP